MDAFDRYSARLRGNIETPDGILPRRLLQAEMAKVFQPIIRGFMLPVFLFYTIVIPANFLLSAYDRAFFMSLSSAITAMTALWFRWVLRKDQASFERLEMIGGITLLMIYINCGKILFVDFSPLNLVYFMLLFLMTAAVAISTRLIVSICTLALATTMICAAYMGHMILIYFTFVSMASGFAAIGMAILMRGALLSTVKARLHAERLQERAEVQADYDALTGLPNRRRFFSHAGAIINGECSKMQSVHLGILDLDGFKPVNDVYGHSVGDELLVAVAHRLSRHIDANTMLARLGGDEFALAIDGHVSVDEILGLGQVICEALREPFEIGGIGISISGCIGFAHYPRVGATLQEIYERADHALYRAKHDTCGDVVVFSAKHEPELSDAGRIAQALRNADMVREFSVVFQPQWDIDRGCTIGFEALARWQSPVLGCVPPSRFIAVAERSGMVARITSILLQKTLAAAKNWPADKTVSFNLSGLDLVSETSIDNIVRLVEESGVAPARITFEITETAMMNDVKRAQMSLERLSSLGCAIALDDFGAGYSSFAYIHRFPLDRIKIDRIFVTRMADDQALACNILRTIANLANSLGVQCLAEGIENEAELQAVRASGIHLIQGYLLGKPIPAAEIPDYLDAEQQTFQARSPVREYAI